MPDRSGDSGPSSDVRGHTPFDPEALPSRGLRATWQGAVQRLDRALPESGLVRSRSQASEFISAGKVRVDGRIAVKAGQKVCAGSVLEVHGADHYVSRAAHKLIAGLENFGIVAADRTALDLGCSTGGFTQVLLERGARRVLAVDVGHGQMVTRLRDDDRVHLIEGCNARDLTAERLALLTNVAEQPALVVADLSFISLTLILPAIARTAAANADLVLLIKPQFEVGRSGIRDGIVVSDELRAAAIRTVLSAAAAHGYGAKGLEKSPIEGGNGNIEYLVHFVREAAPDPTEWEGRIDALRLSDAPQLNSPREEMRE